MAALRKRCDGWSVPRHRAGPLAVANGAGPAAIGAGAHRTGHRLAPTGSDAGARHRAGTSRAGHPPGPFRIRRRGYGVPDLTAVIGRQALRAAHLARRSERGSWRPGGCGPDRIGERGDRPRHAGHRSQGRSSLDCFAQSARLVALLRKLRLDRYRAGLSTIQARWVGALRRNSLRSCNGSCARSCWSNWLCRARSKADAAGYCSR